MSSLELQLQRLEEMKNSSDVSIVHIEVLEQLINLMYDKIIDMPKWLENYLELKGKLDVFNT